MAQPKDKKPDTPAPPTGDEPAGRVEFDSRGNSVWRWAREALDNTSILLKRLENNELAIEPTRKVPIMRDGKGAGKPGKPGKHEKKLARGGRDPSGSAEPDSDSGGGFDPYNSRR